MEPPSYEEASLHPHNPAPPPSYDASLSTPSTPPPTYGEAVTFQSDPFPVLTPPTVVTSPRQNTETIVHSYTQVGVTPTVSARRPQVAVVQAPPTVTHPVTSRPHVTETIVHSHSRVGVTPPVTSRHPQVSVVVSQPPPVPVAVTCLRDDPALVHCPHCDHMVTSTVTNLPGKTAWCLCVMLSLMGLVCGFCLIPLVARGLQDAHHSCPQCGNHLHTHVR